MSEGYSICVVFTTGHPDAAFNNRKVSPVYYI